MVLEGLGKEFNLESLQRYLRTDSQGTTALELVRVLRDFGLAAKGIFASPDRLVDIPLPVIVHCFPGHFVVLSEISTNHVHVLDPLRGHLRMSFASFSKRFTGVAIAVR
jgi:ATP-binding cassette subfamily B protein RaxB